MDYKSYGMTLEEPADAFVEAFAPGEPREEAIGRLVERFECARRDCARAAAFFAARASAAEGQARIEGELGRHSALSEEHTTRDAWKEIAAGSEASPPRRLAHFICS